MDWVKNTAQKVIARRGGNNPPAAIASSTAGGGIAFDDEMPISKPAIVLHSFQIFFSFIAMCCFASVAAFQAKWNIGPSALSGFAIFCAVTNMLLALVLVLVPVVYDKYNKMTRVSRALRELRVAFILVGSGLGEVFLVAFIATISSWTEAGCKDASKDPNAKKGDSYTKALPGWCQTKKAGSIFFWLSTIVWIASFVLVVLDWREGRPVLGAGLRTTSAGIGSSSRPRDPPFRRPTHDDAESVISCDPSRYRRRDEDDDEEDEEIQSPFADPRGAYVPTSGGQGRASMDMYGAFSDPAPSGYTPGGPPRPGSAGGYGAGRTATSPPPATAQYQQPPRGPPANVSRTMALAYEDTGTTDSSGYEDPYDRVRATLATPANNPNAPPTYQQYRLS